MRFSPGAGSRDDAPFGLAVAPYRVAQPQVVAELRRARRYEHPLGVVLLGLQPAPRARTASGAAVVPATEVTPAAYALLGAYLRNTLRETDIITIVPETLAFALFLPGVGRAGAELAVERFREGFRDCAGFELRAGVASFPDDGLTIEDVLERAWQSWRRSAPADLASNPEPRLSHG